MKNVKEKLISGILAIAVAFTQFHVIKVTASEAPAYTHEDAVTVNNGSGALELGASDVAKFSSIESFTVNMTYSLSNSSGLHSLMFIGDSTNSYHYLSLYVNAATKTIGVESLNANNSYNFRNSKAATELDLTKPHRLSFTITGGSGYSIYLDGKEFLSGTTTSNFTKDALTNVNYLAFGKGVRGSNTNAYPMSGTISNIECYTQALSEADILGYQNQAQGSLVYEKSNLYQTQNRLRDTEASHVDAVKGLTEGTIFVRYKADTNTSLAYLFTLSDNSVQNKFISLYIQPTNGRGVIGLDRGGDLGSQFTTHSLQLPEGLSINDTNWHTITLTRSAATTSVYLDGVSIGSTTTTKEGFFDLVDTANSIGLGYADRNSGNANALNGNIDTVRVYSKVLQESDIASLHASTAASDQLQTDISGAYKTEAYNLFYPGYDDSSCYRIPALITTLEGTLLAGIDQRYSGFGDHGNIDSIVRRKEAGQKEFGDVIKVTNLMTNKTSGKSAFTIDAALLQDTDTKSPHYGRIYMIMDMFPESLGSYGHMYQPGSEGLTPGSGYLDIDGVKYLRLTDAAGNIYAMKENGEVYSVVDNSLKEKTEYQVMMEVKAPYTERGNIYKNGEYKGNIYMLNPGDDEGELKITKTEYLWLSHSDDDGKTWSNPVDLNAQVKEDWMIFLGVGPGRGLQLQNGRLIFPVYSANNVQFAPSQSSALIYSDDYGTTWELGESPQIIRGYDPATMTSGGIITESQAVQLKNGDIKLFMRNGISNKMQVATSKDGGTTWASFEELPDVIEVDCQLSVITYTGKDGKEYILLSNPMSGQRRIDGYVRRGEVNADGSITWGKQQLISAGKFEYSCLTQIADAADGTKRFALLYEVNGNGETRYTEFDENFLTAPDISKEQVNPKNTAVDAVLNGNTLHIEMTFDQPIFAVGDAKLQLQIGSDTVDAAYVSGSGSETIVFEATLTGAETGIVTTKGIDKTNGVFENKQALEVDFSQAAIYDLTQIRNGLTIHDYSSQHSASTAPNTDGAAVNILDGNPNTYWHSTYGNPSITMPQHVTVKMNEAASLYKLGYLARQSNLNGCAKDYRIEVSSDGTTFTEIESGQLVSTKDKQYIEFAPTAEVSYVRFTVLSTHSSGSSTAIAELELYAYSDGVIASGDRTKLQNLVNNINKLQRENYSVSSFHALMDEKTVSEALLKESILSQTRIDMAYTKLNRLMKQLIDITAINDMKQTIADLKEVDYTPNSWKLFNDSIADLEDQINAIAVAREVSDIVVKTTYKLSLLETVADTSELLELITKYEEELKDMDEADYEKEKWSAFQNALKDAKAIVADKNAKQEAVEAAKAALVSARVDLLNARDALTELYNEYKDSDASKYTKESFDNLTRALEQAKVVLDDADSTDKALKEAYIALEAAVENLAVRPDTSALSELYNILSELNLDSFINEGKSEFKEALKLAEAVIENPESDEAVQAAIDSLNQAYKGLVEKADKASVAEMENYLNNFEVINMNHYDEALQQRVIHIISEMKALLEQEETSKEAVEALLQEAIKLQAELDQIDKKPSDPTEPSDPTNPSDPTTPIKPIHPNNPIQPNKPIQPGIMNNNQALKPETTPNTGDSTMLTVYAWITLCAGAVMLFTYRKHQKETK